MACRRRNKSYLPVKPPININTGTGMGGGDSTASGHKGIRVIGPSEKYGIVAYAVMPSQTWNTPARNVTNLGLRLWVKSRSAEAFIYEPSYVDHSKRVWRLGYAVDSLPFYYETVEELVIGERIYLSIEGKKDGGWQIHYGIGRLEKDYFLPLPDEKFKGRVAEDYGVSLEGTFNCYGDLGLNTGFSILSIALIREPVYPIETKNLDPREHRIEHYGGGEEVLGVLLKENNLYLKPCIPPFIVEERSIHG